MAFFQKERTDENMKKRLVSMAAGLLVAMPAVLTGCQGEPVASGSAVSADSAISSQGQDVVSSAVSAGEEESSVVSQPEPFVAADQSFSVILPQGFVEQNTDPASGTTTWIDPKKQIILVATSVRQGLQADALTQEAMAQTLAVTYEQVEIQTFTQKPKGTGTLFMYDAAVTQNDTKSYLIQALYADEDQTITLAMTIPTEEQLQEARTMVQAMAESLEAL